MPVITQLVEEPSTEVGGTFLPKSVYEARGYVIDAGFEERNPRRWSPGLNSWTYLLAEVSISEKEIHATVEKQIVEAERAVKKRKCEALTAEQSETAEKASNKTSTTMIMDLLSDDEECQPVYQLYVYLFLKRRLYEPLMRSKIHIPNPYHVRLIYQTPIKFFFTIYKQNR